MQQMNLVLAALGSPLQCTYFDQPLLLLVGRMHDSKLY